MMRTFFSSVVLFLSAACATTTPTPIRSTDSQRYCEAKHTIIDDPFYRTHYGSRLYPKVTVRRGAAKVTLAREYEWRDEESVPEGDTYEVDLELISFDRTLEDEAVSELLAERGYRPATVDELIALKEHLPRSVCYIDDLAPIAAPGSSGSDPPARVRFMDIYRAYLIFWTPEREWQLRVANLPLMSQAWSHRTRFLAVKKEGRPLTGAVE